MIVKYTKCDICNCKIEPGKKWYRNHKIFITSDPVDTLGDPVKIEQTLDVCTNCFDKFYEWVNSQKGAKNGTSA